MLFRTMGNRSLLIPNLTNFLKTCDSKEKNIYIIIIIINQEAIRIENNSSLRQASYLSDKVTEGELGYIFPLSI